MTQNYVLVGKKVATSKTGTKYYSYYFQVPFTDYELENAECTGCAVAIENCTKDFPNVGIGDEVILSYAKGFQDKAVLNQIVVVQKNPCVEDGKKK